jgi:type I site-specific restriction endonuclease
VNKSELSEAGICAQYITPPIPAVDWDDMPQICREVSVSAGLVIVRRKLHTRGKCKRADYTLTRNSNLSLSGVDGPPISQSADAGIQQAMTCTEMLSERTYWQVPNLGTYWFLGSEANTCM